MILFLIFVSSSCYSTQSINLRKLPVGFSLLQPKGRVIQVEDGITERQPSADIRRRPRNRDSGVVIQVSWYFKFPSLSLSLCSLGIIAIFHHVVTNSWLGDRSPCRISVRKCLILLKD